MGIVFSLYFESVVFIQTKQPIRMIMNSPNLSRKQLCLTLKNTSCSDPKLLRPRLNLCWQIHICVKLIFLHICKLTCKIRSKVDRYVDNRIPLPETSIYVYLIEGILYFILTHFSLHYIIRV